MSVLLIIVGLFLAHKYARTQAVDIKAKNLQIENTYNALVARKEFAQEAQAQDAETYALAVKISRK